MTTWESLINEVTETDKTTAPPKPAPPAAPPWSNNDGEQPSHPTPDNRKPRPAPPWKIVVETVEEEEDEEEGNIPNPKPTIRPKDKSPPKPSPKPWNMNDGKGSTRPKVPSAKSETPRPAPPWYKDTGAPDQPSRKRTGKEGSDLSFERSASPMAKRAVLRTTPEKMKRHVGDTAVTWLLEDLERNTRSSGLTERQRKYQETFVGLMAPLGEALNHLMAPLLLELATLGCTANVGEGWTLEMLETAIKKESHPSAMVPEAAGQLQSETLEKVAKAMPGSLLGRSYSGTHPRTSKSLRLLQSLTKVRGFRMTLVDLSQWGSGRRCPIPIHQRKPPIQTQHPEESPWPNSGSVLPRLI